METLVKTPKEITDDILSSLRMKDAPEAILIEAYLEVVIKRIKEDAVKKYIVSQDKKN